jgi:hypothetical protein
MDALKAEAEAVDGVREAAAEAEMAVAEAEAAAETAVAVAEGTAAEITKSEALLPETEVEAQGAVQMEAGEIREEKEGEQMILTGNLTLSSVTPCCPNGMGRESQ